MTTSVNGAEGNALDLVLPDRVHRDVYTDPTVFEMEMENIFMHTWVYVGHESEIARPGDYKTTEVGNKPVILSRDRDGAIHVLMNRCRHRGATVCQWPTGNATSFRCRFHGWTYDQAGRLTGVAYQEGYSGLDKSALSLESAPLVESYRGLVFASFDRDVPTLREHLGPALEFLDRFIDHIPGHGLRAAPQAQRLRYPANWKIQMENSLDGYHANFTHASFFSIMQARTAQPAQYVSAKRTSDSVALGNGHAMLDQRVAAGPALRRRLDTLPGAPAPGTDLDALFGVPDGEQLYAATPGPGFNLAIFPNLALVGIHLREIHPVSVDRTDVVLRPMLADGGPDPINRLRLRYHELFYGPSGFGQPDDLEMFDRIKEGNSAGTDPWIRLDRGLDREVTEADGSQRGDITDETPQRGQYRQWRALMAKQW
ncbi:aromatic ring-hydroxylating oxygenase subunit alpha [Micromonospora radicis]|uniref:Aromatic ring-hydroxylating dioxygenase subunit alpha n=1 Tax=Micromonospora radicis TaxID=1894971 RepID=A0A418MWQ9_9ACTN|nr:aromatic ring-hydroxylating dioxygenase subunit alpha [Micromonospora radicis]RIV39216.1 aromatic ring-hydroxylating dioxygenase subunit alpha [Micromonospora radicis]